MLNRGRKGAACADNYSYDNKLLLSVSARYDGSSRFGADTKWGFFPAGSVGWRMSQEDFMQNISWISNFKPRISYGVTGNNTGIGYYSSIGRLESTAKVTSPSTFRSLLSEYLQISFGSSSFDRNSYISAGSFKRFMI